MVKTTEDSASYIVIVLHSAEDDVYHAHIPTLGIVTQGDSVEEAFWMAQDAISLWLKTAREDGVPIPVEDQPVEVRRIAG